MSCEIPLIPVSSKMHPKGVRDMGFRVLVGLGLFLAGFARFTEGAREKI